MSVREVVWKISADGMSVTPNVPQECGIQGEHIVHFQMDATHQPNLWKKL